MKIICLKNNLKEAVCLSEKITGKNLTLPILSNILISAEDKILKLTATNLEIGIEIEIPSKIEKTGKLAIPSNIFNSFLSNLSNDENITLESQNNNLLISNLNSSTLIKGQSTDDFPILPKIDQKKEIEISVNDLILGIKSVLYSVSFSNIKPEISSIYVFSGKNIPFTFAATDSFRLAEKKFKYSFNDFQGVLIPYKSAVEILRIFEGKEGKIKLIFDNNQIFLLIDNIKFISRLTEGIFPDYQQIIPKKFTTEIILNKDVLIGALKMTSIFSSRLNEINFNIGPKNDFIIIRTSNIDTGESKVNIPAKITGEELNMVFNHKYIFECLSHIYSPQILFRFSGLEKPLVISGIGDNFFQYVVMPMNNL
jgi:DNA polymerase-3 subunit beta